MKSFIQRSKQALLLAALIHYAPITNAAIVFNGATGASASNLIAGVTPTIYGGMAGDCAPGDYNATSTCNSCANAAGLTTCNRARINPNLFLTISYKSDTATGRPILVAPDGTTVLYVGPTSVPAKSNASVTLVWSAICSRLTDGQSTCLGTASNTTLPGTFKIGVDVNSSGTLDTGDESTSIQISVLNPDPDNTGVADTIDDCTTNAGAANSPGICYFMAYPGDSKVFLEDIESGVGFPSTPSGTISKVNVYASSTGWITSPSQLEPAVLTIENTEITNKIIDGLENGVPHYFRSSVSDQAGNEMFFTSDAAITAECSGVVPPALPTSPFDGTGGGQLCPFAAIPDEVVGLLTKNVNCFIATAAFGSPMSPFVEDFRNFRDEVLMPFKLGRKFVNWYYSWSPEAANWLRHHDYSKTAVRAALVPVWLGTKLIIWWPISLALLLVGISLWRRSKSKVKNA